MYSGLFQQNRWGVDDPSRSRPSLRPHRARRTRRVVPALVARPVPVATEVASFGASAIKMAYGKAIAGLELRTSRFLLREDRVLDGSDQNLVKRRITRLLVLLTHPQPVLDMNELFGR
jgi:hypothetical protein